MSVEVSELDEPTTRKLLGDKKLAAGPGAHAIVVSGTAQSIEMARTVIGLLSTPGETATFESVVAALTPPAVMSQGRLLQARLHAERRRQLIDEFGMFSAADIATIVGSTAGNLAATASRWAKAGRIFGVELDGRNLGYPGFQFDVETGQPVPAVQQILRVLYTHLQSWSLAHWFTSGSSYLDERRPVDLLHSDPALVVESAEFWVQGLS